MRRAVSCIRSGDLRKFKLAQSWEQGAGCMLFEKDGTHFLLVFSNFFKTSIQGLSTRTFCLKDFFFLIASWLFMRGPVMRDGTRAYDRDIKSIYRNFDNWRMLL